MSQSRPAQRGLLHDLGALEVGTEAAPRVVMSTILIIVLIVLLLGGGGLYLRR
jgi:hypothetical protein